MHVIEARTRAGTQAPEGEDCFEAAKVDAVRVVVS